MLERLPIVGGKMVSEGKKKQEHNLNDQKEKAGS